VIFWSDGTLAFAVSGEIAREDLARIAAAIQSETTQRPAGRS
jgi:anti-sigma factor RsiW